MATRIGVDIGGTFTDLVVYDDQRGIIRTEKVPTTPSSPEAGCIDAVKLVSSDPAIIEACEYFLHGTTVGLNALLERRGAKVGLLCTSGFRDVLELRRGSRPEGYDLNWVPPAPLVPRHLRLPVNERVNARGDVLSPIEPQSIQRAVTEFQAHAVTSVAVCFMNSYANPAHEEQAEQLLRDFGFTGDISLSHRLSREYRDYERASTTVIDAFVRTRMAHYLENIASGIQALGFQGSCLLTRSGGGCMSFAEAYERSFETINSGPVAGVEGAAELARALDLGDLVTADVGGTSLDTALIIKGRAGLRHQGEVAGMPIQAPWVDVRSIGAGGGSLAHVGVGGLLHVGPQSAGAQPGPACYGRGGTEATVTDAAFYLGMLGNGRLAAGVNLDRTQAEAALMKVARQLNSSAEAVAVGVIKIACANCANAMREMTLEQGLDPRTLSLFAFGGAGPLLATQMARELGIRNIIVPPLAGNFSAWGLLGSDLIRSVARTQCFELTAEGVERMTQTLAEMFAELVDRKSDRTLLENGVPETRVDMRFGGGQEHALSIPVPWVNDRLGWGPAQLEEAFRARYREVFGMSLDNPVEAIVLRAAVRKSLPRKESPPLKDRRDTEKSSQLPVYSFARETFLTAMTLQRGSLKVAERAQGPAIIYEPTTTTYVDVDFSYGVHANGCLVLSREE